MAHLIALGYSAVTYQKAEARAFEVAPVAPSCSLSPGTGTLVVAAAQARDGVGIRVNSNE